MKKYDYYSDQLNRLKDYTQISLKLWDYSGHSTNQITVNKDSIETIVQFLRDHVAMLDSTNNKGLNNE